MNNNLLYRIWQSVATVILVFSLLFDCTYGDMKKSGPELELKKDIDLGLILDTTAPLEIFIPVKNISDRTITIVGLAKDCSCISVRIDKKKLEPGETATIRYSANIYGKTGRFGSDVIIESDASERFDEIQIRGQITGQIRIRPRTVTLLTGEQDSPGVFTVFCDDQDGKWNYTGYDTDNPHLQVNIREKATSPTTSTYDGVVTIAPGWAIGVRDAFAEAGVTLKFRNDRLGRSLNVILSVQIGVRRKITVDPARVVFIGRNGEQKRTVLVQSGEEIKVDTARCSSPCIEAIIRHVNPKALAIDLVLQPTLVHRDVPENLECDLLSDGKMVGTVPIHVIEIP